MNFHAKDATETASLNNFAVKGGHGFMKLFMKFNKLNCCFSYLVSELTLKLFVIEAETSLIKH